MTAFFIAVIQSSLCRKSKVTPIPFFHDTPLYRNCRIISKTSPIERLVGRRRRHTRSEHSCHVRWNRRCARRGRHGSVRVSLPRFRNRRLSLSLRLGHVGYRPRPTKWSWRRGGAWVPAVIVGVVVPVRAHKWTRCHWARQGPSTAKVWCCWCAIGK